MKSSIWLVLLLCCWTAPSQGYTEKERQQKFHELGHQWPVPKFKPDNPGWDKVMRQRLAQISEIEDRAQRFQAFAITLSASLLQHNYTEHGFGLGRAPDDLMEALRKGVREGVEKGPRNEGPLDTIVGPTLPWFIDRPDLTKRVLQELQRYPETWAGMELVPEIAYGFRLYRNESRLFVHTDKAATHIISFILHIDKSDDAEDWPILIEDLQGRTHEVVLTSGDILFYESSKCFHGRPRAFNGSWYSSVFVHYSPKYGYKDNFDVLQKVWAIPPTWEKPVNPKTQVPLEMHGTSFDEPSCPNGWCATEDSLKWSGPGEEGYILTPTGEKIPFDPTQPVCQDKDARCAGWSIRGECEKNKSYMYQFCAKSCRICGVEGCDDKNEKCATWASWKNECEKNKSYMHQYCAKSCGVCGGHANSSHDEL